MKEQNPPSPTNPSYWTQTGEVQSYPERLQPLTERLLQEAPGNLQTGQKYDKLSHFQGGCRFVKSDPSNSGADVFPEGPQQEEDPRHPTTGLARASLKRSLPRRRDDAVYRPDGSDVSRRI